MPVCIERGTSVRVTTFALMHFDRAALMRLPEPLSVDDLLRSVRWQAANGQPVRGVIAWYDMPHYEG